MKPRYAFLLIIVPLLLAVHPLPASAQTPVPVVQAVLFYKPTCGHCQYVRNEVLPVLFEQYGEQLQLFQVDVTQPEGVNLFLAALEKLNTDRTGVPFLVVGDTFLIGSVDIPEKFPALIDRYLAEGGVSWPDLPGLAEFMASAQATQSSLLVPSPEPSATSTVTATPPPGTPSAMPVTLTPSLIPTTTSVVYIPSDTQAAPLMERLGRDSLGNGLAVLILLGMLFAVGWSTWSFLRKPGHALTGFLLWAFPVLCLAGLVVAGYLAYVEISQAEAYCGLVGDCNTVQQSEYARLFSILPIGLLGVVGYLVILAGWAVMHFTRGKLVKLSALALLLLTVLGTLFSIYLTFLEPFVIGATCIWCLASALISTLLMLLAVPPGKLAFERLVTKKS
jgi:uncharacterized membrane protein